jgi:hypothetical protein
MQILQNSGVILHCSAILTTRTAWLAILFIGAFTWKPGGVSRGFIRISVSIFGGSWTVSFKFIFIIPVFLGAHTIIRGFTWKWRVTRESRNTQVLSKERNKNSFCESTHGFLIS